uniref:(E3-independent) E2 ubiquitin-conjugating enzyme UBE2O isoform X1 n=1 Tax=Anopheles coluzzii TaxID=1518534 RepID=UPI0020FFC26B|nr:(E3-independent) E2 ubiquitin-conjugating enzyme UBE2O isoform X1 [Anopheles coluzzii]XP_040222334.2 (E3-independent) E2 ubiquitin-conjugating enzyme UBE2O isoform X1 [Anopheles coluzzii]
MEKVKSAERAAIIKSRPSPNEQKAVAANAGGPGLNSDGAPALRLRPSQLYHTQHGQQTVATGPLASDRKVHTNTTTTTAVTQQQQQQDRVEHEKVNDKGGRNDRSEERMVEEQEDEEQENQYFYEDEIFCLTPKNGHVKFGLVLDNYDESDEETTEEDAPKRGEIRACWHPDGREEIIKQRKVGLADRTLMPGDVVRRMVPVRDTQRGYCHEITVRADLRIIGTKYVVRNVASDRLRPLLSMPKDSAVCLDSWVGSTKHINEKLVLKSSCGSLVEVCPASDLGMFRDHNMRFRRGFFAEPLFYPGQQLVGLMSELANGKWLTTSNEMKLSRKNYMLERKFTVQSVELQGVSVHWQCKVSSEDLEQKLSEGGSLQQPPEYITGEDLKRLKKLNLFESCMLQINDKNYLKLEDTDIIGSKQAWRKDMTSKYREQLLQESKAKAKPTSKAISGGEEEKKGGKGTKSGSAGSKLSARSAGKENGAQKVSTKLTSVDSDEGWETDEEGEHSDGAASSCSATSKTSPRKSPLLAKRVRKLKRRQLAAEFAGDRFPAAGDEVVTEALVVYSTATVVWQDGTIEPNIPSTELRPIHHLDDHEFFPGDFVLAGNTDPAKNPSFRDYGVIQDVDHHGRTARVKWFSTYTCTSEPQPSYNGESEVSVYDLKDHPDFQYRPGTIVIRVANFTGEEGASTAGQVLDNYPNGMVKVWWVDGFVSMCWPQDIFEVGQYDSENNFWGSVADSDAESWETEAESCHFGDAEPGSPSSVVLKPQLTANLERARVAIARLEELFNINPHLQNQEIMKKLMLVYKKCRFLDRLMNTSFFHERHFMGLVERVRKSNNQTTVERMQDQKNRLFNQSASGSKTSTPTAGTPESVRPSLQQRALFSPSTPTSPAVSSPAGRLEENDNANYNVGIANMELDYVNNMCMKMNENADDVDLNNTSSVFDLATGGGGGVGAESDKPDQEDRETGEQLARECVSARLCSLIKGQLIKVLEEINERYGLEDPLKEIISVVELKTPTLASMPPSWTPSPVGTPDIPGSEPDPLASSSPAVAGADAVPSSPSSVPTESFQIIESAPTSHKFHLTIFQTSNAQSFYKAVQREHWLLRTALPPGVWVRTFEDRLDLLSVMIEGPKKTPYEDGLFLFDIQLGLDYPRAPPLCHYISYCTDRLNPNLYEDGKVCVSLLGTWSGRGTEVWGPTSTLLQVIVSIQGLILVAEPYFNEAGYEKLRGSQQGKENSRMYNEMVLLKLVQSMTKLMSNPPEVFREQILTHFHACGQRMYSRLKTWMELSNDCNRQPSASDQTGTAAIDVSAAATSILASSEQEASSATVDYSSEASARAIPQPEFPLIPASRGFCLTLTGLLEGLQKQLQQLSPLPQPALADGK